MAGVVLGLLVAGCVGTGEPTEAPLCDGIPADMGGCSKDQPAYTGVTCEELAEQWGSEVDRRLTAIIDGPAVVEGEAKSVQQTTALVLVSTRLSQYMDRLGLLDDCDLPEFLPIAELQFSKQLRDGAGSILYDGDPAATYEEWFADMQKFIRVIDNDDAA
jgi:hypothetical protein